MARFASLIILSGVGVDRKQDIHDMVFVEAPDERAAVSAVASYTGWPEYLNWKDGTSCVRIVKIFDMDSGYYEKKLIKAPEPVARKRVRVKISTQPKARVRRRAR